MDGISKGRQHYVETCVGMGVKADVARKRADRWEDAMRARKRRRPKDPDGSQG